MIAPASGSLRLVPPLPAGRSLVAVSDVSIGYGSPQIPCMTRAIAAHYGIDAAVVEPDQPERPTVDTDFGVAVHRIITATHPHSYSGLLEYMHRVVKHVEASRPDVLVVCCFNMLPVLSLLRHRPRLVIYYSLEHLGSDQHPHLAELRRAARHVDLSIFPECNRARLDGARLGLLQRPLHVVYNAAESRHGPAAAEDRLGRIFYGGTLHRTRTFGVYLLSRRMRRFPIDVYGIPDGFSDREVRALKAGSDTTNVRLRGYRPRDRGYFETLQRYDYSIVMWKPDREDQRFAAPNKLFDAVACGVPVIAAPHPICATMVRRYGIGILMDDWSLRSFERALREAMALRGSARYARMVQGTIDAFESELSWSKQVEPLLRRLPDLQRPSSRALASVAP